MRSAATLGAAIDALDEGAAEIERLRALLRCHVTKNLCGTDTWKEGEPCKCAGCQAWLAGLDAALKESP
jgi:hypothetical protein